MERLLEPAGHFLTTFWWNCMDGAQPFQKLDRLGVRVSGRKGKSGERGRERDLAPSLPDT